MPKQPDVWLRRSFGCVEAEGTTEAGRALLSHWARDHERPFEQTVAMSFFQAGQFAVIARRRGFTVIES